MHSLDSSHIHIEWINKSTNTNPQVSGGFNVGQVAGAFSCQTPVANPFDYEACPYELRVYADAIPGTTVRHYHHIVLGRLLNRVVRLPCMSGGRSLSDTISYCCFTHVRLDSCQWRGGTGRTSRRRPVSRRRSTRRAASRSSAAAACARRSTRAGSVRLAFACFTSGLRNSIPGITSQHANETNQTTPQHQATTSTTCKATRT